MHFPAQAPGRGGSQSPSGRRGARLVIKEAPPKQFWKGSDHMLHLPNSLVPFPASSEVPEISEHSEEGRPVGLMFTRPEAQCRGNPGTPDFPSTSGRGGGQGKGSEGSSSTSDGSSSRLSFLCGCRAGVSMRLEGCAQKAPRQAPTFQRPQLETLL